MWKFYQPTDIVFGEGERRSIGALMKAKGLGNALLVADPAADQLGYAQQLIDAAEGRIVAMTSDVAPNPTVDNVDNGIRMVKENGATCVVAIGGGSAMDCAKATAAAVASGYIARDLMEGKPIQDALPVIAIPTTAGTGSEVTAGAVLSDPSRNEKIAIFGPSIFPKLSIVDPELTYSCPKRVTASSGTDVLMHALDALSSVKANPATDVLAVAAAKLVLQNLEQVVDHPDDQEARRNMSQASLLAGLAFSQTGTTGSHACSYVLTARYHLPHGEACAFTADSWLLINAKARPALNGFAKELGYDSAESLSVHINTLKKKFGMAMTLADAGIRSENIPDVVIECLKAKGNLLNNVAQVDANALQSIFESKQ